MMIADFQVEDKGGRARFFQEAFLIVDTKFEVILEMSFLKISNTNVAFGKKTLTQKFYITSKTLPTTKQVQLVDPKEFIIIALDADSEVFVMHVAIQEQEEMAIDPNRKAQIEVQSGAQSGAQVGALIFDKAPIEVPVEYSDYSAVFSAKNIAELPEHTRMNDNTIKLEEGKQPFFGPIYSPEPVELETLKTYIKTNLPSSFISPFKSSAGAPILFHKKPDRSFCFCVDYRGLNNITIKNRYLLPLIGKLLDRLGWARRFTQLDLTNAYYRMQICEGDEQKTAFRTRYAHFKYQVMSFDFFNAPTRFQGYVNKILAKKIDIFVIVYLDDILIYTKNSGQPHVKTMRQILNQLRK